MVTTIKRTNNGIASFGIWVVAAITLSMFFWVPLVDAFNVSKFALLAVVSLATIPYLVSNAHRTLKGNPLTYGAFFFFLIALVINVFTATNPRLALFGSPSRFAGALMYVSLLIICIVSFQKFQESSFLILVWGLFLLGLLESGYGWLQVFEKDPITWNNPYGLIIGTVGNADFAGALIGICGVATLWLIVFGGLTILTRVSLSLVVVSEVILISKANIRQSLVIFLLGMVMFTLWKLRSSRPSLFLPGLFSGFLGFGLIALGAFQIGPLTSLVYKPSVSMRGDYWRAAVRMFKDEPLTGIGLGSFGDLFPLYRDSIQVARRGPNYVADAAHSVFLDYMSMGGILLLLPYLTLVALGFWKLFSNFSSRTEQSQNIRVGLSALWLAYLAQSAISLDQIGLAIWGWVFMGCAMALGKVEDNSKSMKLNRNLKVRLLTPIFAILGALILSPTWQADIYLKRAMIIGTSNTSPTAASARLEFLKTATSKDPKNPWYYQNAALLLLQSGQIEGIDYAKKALSLNSNDVLSAKLLAMSTRQVGDIASSDKYVALVNKLDPLANFR